MSIWNKKEIQTKKRKLHKDIDVDILIIGAGMTGMMTAYYLRDEKNVCVVDAGIIGHGVTLNTTAKINYFQERIYTKIKKSVNQKTAIQYLNSQKYAIDHLKKMMEQEKIDCDFKKVPSFVFANTKKEIQPLIKEIEFLRKNKVDVKEMKLPSKITSYKSYAVEDTYIFNPIKYLQQIYHILCQKHVPIYENTKILKIEKQDHRYICLGTHYKIRAKKVILACHYPFFLLPFLLPMKSYIEKSYIIVSKVKKDGGFTCISSSNPTYSCRFYKDDDNIYQISLAESHNTSIKQDDVYHFNRVKEIFELKESDIVMSYSNTDIITVDHMPYIGKLKENIYIGVGYNTWGMTNSILAAKIISDALLHRDNEYQEILNPNRMNLSNIIKLPLILFSQTKSFIGPKIIKNKSWYSSNLTFIKKEGKNLAIYKDQAGIAHTVYNKCPHLGCSLIFNERELTWDCPCHSSRFDIDGKCIKGPSNYDISYKK